MTMKLTRWAWSVVAILILTTTSTKAKAHPEGDDNCSHDNGIPVCATNGNENHLFSNKCELEKALKSGEELQRTPLRNCLHKCRFYCVSIYEPLCAVDPSDNSKRTFHNRCELVKNSCILNKDWSIHKNGICHGHLSKDTKRKKRNTGAKRGNPIPCPKVFNPVCAMLSGVKTTFINECLLNAENVKLNKEWQIISEGMCGEDYSYYTPRSHKVRRRFTGNLLDGFGESLFLGDDFIQIRPQPIFQTHFVKDSVTPLISDRSKSFKYPPTYQSESQRNYFTNFELENLRPRYKYQADGGFEVQEGTYVDFETTLSDILRSLQRNIEDKQRKLFVDTSNCILGNVPLCCEFQGDKHTFKNICELNVHNENTGQEWIIYHEGECNECDINCSQAFDPVCASRKGLNYTIRNECLLNSIMCRDKLRDWKFLTKGICYDSEHKTIRDKYESKPRGFPSNFHSTKSPLVLLDLKTTTTEVSTTNTTNTPPSITSNPYFSKTSSESDTTTSKTVIRKKNTIRKKDSRKRLKHLQTLKPKSNSITDRRKKSFSFVIPANKNITTLSLNDIKSKSDISA